MARRSAAALVVAILATLLPGGAAVAAPDAVSAPLSPVAAVERAQDSALAGLAIPSRILDAAAEAAGRNAPSSAVTTRAGAASLDSGLAPAGDFNHDGVRDVLDVRYQSVGSAA